MVDHISTPPFPERLIEPVRNSLAGEPATWPDSLTSQETDAIDAHGMAPLVYEWSRIEGLRRRAIEAAARETLHLESLRTLLRALATAGVQPIILKGSALAYQVYAKPELRPRGDTDLLVRESDVPMVRHVMATLGFVENITSGDEHGLRQATWYRTDDFGCDHNFDVHWSIANPAAFANLILYDEALPDSVPIDTISAEARGLDRERALLLACVHRIAHHHDSDRLVWLIDIALLARGMAEFGWARLRNLAVAGKVVAITAHSLVAAGTTLHIDVGSGVSLPAATDEPSALYLRRDAQRFRFLMNELSSLPSWSARRKRLRDLAFPPAGYMRREFGSSSPIALPLVYLARGIRGVIRLFRRVA